MKRHPMSGAVAKTVIDREGGFCAVCGLSISGIGHIHHRKPRGMGGGRYANTVSNLLYLHHSCHLYEVEQNRSKAYERGWLVKASDTPSEVPVCYMLRDWVLLDDQGHITPVDPVTATTGLDPQPRLAGYEEDDDVRTGSAEGPSGG